MELRKILFVPLCLLLQSPMVVAADVMQERRLFFTQRQRNLLDTPVAESAKKETGLSQVIGENAFSRASIDSKRKREYLSSPPSVPYSHVIFNGLMMSRKHIHILVNGLPCQALPLVESSAMESFQSVNCPHLKGMPFSLLFYPEAGQLLVQPIQGTKTKLSPGESF